MATPRLSGGLVSAIRILAESPLRGLVWRSMGQSYGLFGLNDLPEEAHGVPSLEERAVAGAPPRSGPDEEGEAAAPRKGTARALRLAYQRQGTTPVAVLEALRARVERAEFGKAGRSPFIALAWARAHALAEASAARWRAGRPLGPLDGVPVPVKDEHDMVGLPTMGGTRWRTQLAGQDSLVVQRLEAAGALVYGKTHTTEWGMSPLGFNPCQPMPRNVYSRDHAPGGSSTGSAVAVALGMAPVAVGSDGGGSIRIPAAMNGLFGLKPNFVRVPRAGDIFADGTVSHIGPIGRSVEDLVDLLGVIAGPDPRDPLSAYPGAAPVASWRAALGRGVQGVRIGVDEAEWADAAPEVARVADEALRGLEREGARRVSVKIPYAKEAPAAGVLVIANETMGGLLRCLPHLPEMGEDLRIILALLRGCATEHYFAARSVRAGLRRNLAAVMAGVDLLALPTTAALPPAWPFEEDQTAIVDEVANQQAVRFSFLANLTGLPAGTAPAGMVDGLPVGLQLVGDAHDEASVIAGLAAVERLGIGRVPDPDGFVPLESVARG